MRRVCRARSCGGNEGDGGGEGGGRDWIRPVMRAIRSDSLSTILLLLSSLLALLFDAISFPLLIGFFLCLLPCLSAFRPFNEFVPVRYFRQRSMPLRCRFVGQEANSFFFWVERGNSIYIYWTGLELGHELRFT